MSQQIANCQRLIDEMAASAMQFDAERVQRAWEVAQEAYKEKQHWTGIDMMEHVLGVLETLMPYHPDEEAIVACLLHEVLTEKYMSLQELEEAFGLHTRNLVSGAHLLSHVTLRDRRNSVEDLRLMLLTVSEDARTILLILADRSYLLDHIGELEPEEQRRIARDVLQLFAPVAARLGIYTLKHSLEARAFPVLYGDDAERITEQLEQVKQRYGTLLHNIAAETTAYLQGEGIAADVQIREKQPYSIFRKMEQKGLTHVLDLYDLFALRVIVASEPECYQVLGLLHKMGKPVANRFKDYISFPKPNGYRSLHTTLVQLPGVEEDSLFVEVQVRTSEMHQDAQYGVAAHWMYKEGGTASAAHSAQLHSMLAGQEPVDDHEEEANSAYVDHIYTLSPRGDVVELPEGATPLDFAFQIHTDLGLRFHSARVNGSIVPLDYHLENGDMVEITKRKQPQPSPQWMQLLKMSSSRAKLKRYLYAQDRPMLVIEGRNMVNEELRKRGLPLLDTDLSIMRREEGRQISKTQREDLLMKIGQGAERVLPVLQRMDELAGKLETPPQQQTVKKISRSQPQFELESEVPLPTRCAKCCKPDEWPRGPLMGVVGRQGVVMVHRKDCGMLRNANPERMIRMWWHK